MKKKDKKGYYNAFFSFIIIFVISLRMVLYIPVSPSYCTENKYKKGYCDFVEINDRYAILNKQYFGGSGIYEMLGIVETKPIYLFDKTEDKIIRKGKIGWWVNSDNLKNTDYELYFKDNYGGRFFSSYYTPSPKKHWIIGDAHR